MKLKLDFYDIYLRGVGFCYFIAFYSLNGQWRGLFGVDGIQPVDSWFNPNDYSKASNSTNVKMFLTDLFYCYKEVHSFGCFANSKYSDTHIDYILEALLNLGVLLSGLIMFHLPLLQRFKLQSFTFFTCWFIYLSLFTVGKVFLQFQWDTLLLEVGFATIFYSIYENNLAKTLLRCILFKLMFMSGIVKLQSNCPTWWNLTALDFHFATQCLPTPLSWYAHQAPHFIKRTSVAITLLIEVIFFVL